jgi:hypothetical protein
MKRAEELRQKGVWAYNMQARLEIAKEEGEKAMRAAKEDQERRSKGLAAPAVQEKCVGGGYEAVQEKCVGGGYEAVQEKRVGLGYAPPPLNSPVLFV